MADYGSETVIFFEIDQPLCTHTYGDGVGVSPTSGCEAQLGVTGTRKCRNTRATCQDSANYNPALQTVRFTRSQEGLLQYGNHLPAMLSAPSTTPAKINLGGLDRNMKALGEREIVTVNLQDFLHSGHLLDKYRLERATGDASLLASGTAQDGSTISLTLAADETVDPTGKQLRLTSGSGSTQRGTVLRYDATAKVATMTEKWDAPYLDLPGSADDGTMATLVMDLIAAQSLTPKFGSAAFAVTRAGNTATRVNASGLIEIVNADLPRFDYDPVTLACKGQLIEEARTNYALSSTNFAAWTNQNTPVVTSDSAIAPDGTLSADTIADDDATLYDAKFATGLPANVGGSVCLSVYVKKDAVGQATRFTLFRAVLSGAVGPQLLELNIDTSTGERSAFAVNAGGSYITNSAVEDHGDYWRVWVSGGTTDAGWTSTDFYIFPAVGAGPLATNTGMYSAAATGSVTVWGAQFEIGKFPTSAIFTIAAAVTRNADVVSTPTGSWFSAAEGTVVVEFVPGTLAPSWSSIVSINDGTANERYDLGLELVNSKADLYVVDGGVTQVTALGSGSGSAPVVGAVYRSAYAYRANDFAASNQGAAADTAAAGTLPTVTRLQLGNDVFNRFLNGHLRKFIYFPKRLLNATLTSIAASGPSFAPASYPTALPDATTTYEVREAYDPYTRGTFWGKWLAANPYYQSYDCRVREGFLGQDLDEMRVRHYVIDKVEGPSGGTVKITAKDAFAIVDARKSVAPFPSNGILSGALSSGATSFDVTPAGIGGSEYPDSGYVCINDEIMSFTRVYDTFTVTRGQLNTVAAAHDDESTVQLVLTYSSESAHDIVYDLLTTYAGVDAADIPLTEWDERTAALSVLYSANIPNPTSVSDLIGELCKQAGFTVYPEVTSGTIKLATLRATGQSLAIDDDTKALDGTISVKRQDTKRVSEVWVYYGQIDPTKAIDEETNYLGRVVIADLEAEGSTKYGSPAIDKVFSRWISSTGRAQATTVGERILTVFTNPPIELSFGLDIGQEDLIDLAYFLTVNTADVQDDDGSTLEFTAAVTEIEFGESRIGAKAQQISFSEDDGLTRNIFIDQDAVDLNLRTLHDSQYATPLGGSPGEVINFTIASGATVWSTSTLSAALTVGTWPAGVTVTLTIEGEVKGQGGSPGVGGTAVAITDGSGNPVTFYANAGGDGTDGGPAIDARDYPISITNNGAVRGGAGGSSGGGGCAVIKWLVGHAASGSGAGASTFYTSKAGAQPGGVSSDNRPVQGNAGGSSSSTAAGAGGAAVTGSGVGNVGYRGGKGGDGATAGSNGNSGDAGVATENVESGATVLTGAAGTPGTVGDAAWGDSNITWLVAGTRQGALVP